AHALAHDPTGLPGLGQLLPAGALLLVEHDDFDRAGRGAVRARDGHGLAQEGEALGFVLALGGLVRLAHVRSPGLGWCRARNVRARRFVSWLQMASRSVARARRLTWLA